MTFVSFIFLPQWQQLNDLLLQANVPHARTTHQILFFFLTSPAKRFICVIPTQAAIFCTEQPIEIETLSLTFSFVANTHEAGPSTSVFALILPEKKQSVTLLLYELIQFCPRSPLRGFASSRTEDKCFSTLSLYLCLRVQVKEGQFWVVTETVTKVWETWAGLQEQKRREERGKEGEEERRVTLIPPAMNVKRRVITWNWNEQTKQGRPLQLPIDRCELFHISICRDFSIMKILRDSWRPMDTSGWRLIYKRHQSKFDWTKKV